MSSSCVCNKFISVIMSLYKNYFLKLIIIITSFSFFSCANVEKKQIGNPRDYSSYLFNNEASNENKVLKKLDFWSKKYAKSPSQYLYLNKMAITHESLFEMKGNIVDLKKAQNLFEKSLMENDNQVGVLHSLCRNYISQHKFKECLPLLRKAKKIGYKTRISNQILFDVYLELGDIENAKSYLDSIKNPNDFNYLIRISKWEDYNGKLDSAIRYLEVARKNIANTENNYLKIWTYSNLGDFYGHQGNIEKSYQYYLKTLKLNPQNWYVLKKIAWIQYAHNKNIEEANSILENILKYTQTPDLYLFKAELAEFNEDSISGVIYKKQFEKLVTRPEYGVMYNKYLINIWADVEEKQQLAIITAKEEIKNRPTPQSYDLLAWSYHQAGFHKKALQIAEQYVAGNTFEPEVIYHLAKIYEANNVKKQKIKSLKKELTEATFELGPLITRQIEEI